MLAGSLHGQQKVASPIPHVPPPLMELSQTNAQKWGSVTPIWQLPVILAPQLLNFPSSIVICVSEPAS
jgi:hypothetical protein